jgi:hypothetical protein
MHPNGEFREMLELVGIDPERVPAVANHVAARHVELLLRFVGYRAGLIAAAASRQLYDADKEAPAIMGDVIERRLTFPDPRSADRPLYHEMHRQLALVEGATGYPMTSERAERRAVMYFWKAVLSDIKDFKASCDISDGRPSASLQNEAGSQEACLSTRM